MMTTSQGQQRRSAFVCPDTGKGSPAEQGRSITGFFKSAGEIEIETRQLWTAMSCYK